MSLFSSKASLSMLSSSHTHILVEGDLALLVMNVKASSFPAFASFPPPPPGGLTFCLPFPTVPAI